MGLWQLANILTCRNFRNDRYEIALDQRTQARLQQRYGREIREKQASLRNYCDFSDDPSNASMAALVELAQNAVEACIEQALERERWERTLATVPWRYEHRQGSAACYSGFGVLGGVEYGPRGLTWWPDGPLEVHISWHANIAQTLGPANIIVNDALREIESAWRRGGWQFTRA